MKRAIACATLALAAAGCGGGHESTAPPAPAMDVTTSVARAMNEADVLEAGGVVRPRLHAAITSRVVAPVERVLVTAGARVRAGQLLVVLDTRQAAADASRATAMLDAARRGADASGSEVAAADAAVTLARQVHGRMQALHATRAATEQELDDTTAGLKAAEANLAAAQAHAQQGTAAVSAAEDAVRTSSIVRGYGALTAPFDGIVTSRSADPGSLASPGVPLLEVETINRFTLDASVDERLARALAPDMTVDARIDSGPWTPATVHEIERAIDPASHTVTVKVLLPDSPPLRSGMFGAIRIPGEARRTIVVNRTALVTRGDLTFVYVVDRDTARLRLVRTGRSEGGHARILAGVAEGDRIVDPVPPTLVDGMTVRAREPR